jgi:integrase
MKNSLEPFEIMYVGEAASLYGRSTLEMALEMIEPAQVIARVTSRSESDILFSQFGVRVEQSFLSDDDYEEIIDKIVSKSGGSVFVAPSMEMELPSFLDALPSDVPLLRGDDYLPSRSLIDKVSNKTFRPLFVDNYVQFIPTYQRKHPLFGQPYLAKPIDGFGEEGVIETTGTIKYSDDTRTREYIYQPILQKKCEYVVDVIYSDRRGLEMFLPRRIHLKERGIEEVTELMSPRDSQYSVLRDFSDGFLGSIGYVGAANVQFIEDVESQLYYLETNPRFSSNACIWLNQNINPLKSLLDFIRRLQTSNQKIRENAWYTRSSRAIPYLRRGKITSLNDVAEESVDNIGEDKKLLKTHSSLPRATSIPATPIMPTVTKAVPTTIVSQKPVTSIPVLRIAHPVLSPPLAGGAVIRKVGFRSIQELNTLLDGVDNQLYRLIFKIILGTGMRSVEVISLKIQDVGVKDSRPIFKFADFRTKEYRMAYIPYILLEEIQDILTRLVQEENQSDEAFLFPGLQPRGGKGKAGVGERTLRRHLKYAAPSSAYPEVSLGYLRQCFGWFLKDLGASEEHLYNVLGKRHALDVIRDYDGTPKYDTLPENILSPLDTLVDWAAIEKKKRKERLASLRSK